jgi:hypothetical protein
VPGDQLVRGQFGGHAGPTPRLKSSSSSS